MSWGVCTAEGVTHGDVHLGNVMINQQEPVLIDLSDGCFKANRMGRDIMMLTFALVECSVKPVMNAGHLGRIPLNKYDVDRKTAMKKVLEDVAKGGLEVPDGVRAFVRDIVSGLKNTNANDPLIRQHPFLNGCKTDDKL